MSLSGALSNATSGLTAATRAAQLVSSNVANAQTDGYGRRELQLAPNVVGGVGAGVSVTGVSRVVDQAAINDRRLADASLGASEQNAAFFRSIEAALGTPDDPGSLSAAVAKLETELVTAASMPQNETQLEAALIAADTLASRIHTGVARIGLERQQADTRIGQQVGQINAALSQVADLNVQIQLHTATGGDAAGLMDQRQRAIDSISSLLPVREVPRDNGMIALITPNGTTLVEQDAAQFAFAPTPTIVPEMSLASGALSGLTLTGASSSAGTAMQAIAGGALAANFTLRDETSVAAQAGLDALARNLIERTSSAEADPNLAGVAGLFSDQGAPFDPNLEVGLSSRIAVNPALDPNQGGEVWRLRDGITAATPGPEGETARLTALASVLSGDVTGGMPALEGSFSATTATFVSGISQSRIQSENQVSFASSMVITFATQEQAQGVDTDQELQKLLTIEQSYAANAKLIETIDQMLQSLLRI